MSALIDGVVVRMGGRDWTVPPLSFKQLRGLQPQLELLAKLAGTASPRDIGVISDIVLAALSRNYPEITLDEVEAVLDLGNAGRVITAILTGSGLSRGEGGPGSA